ncbi:MAG TPA: MBL fold metallo-hydrolase [Chitinophagaceae bacterium]|jgi:glyoxylase-like metal-dependent hydrolase (beta-lactamase superfamily II)|nr:MBL fold metallo-hydrolase [Chitinophagaceae bacterium]
MSETPLIDTETLSNWLETGKEISILDVRPMNERSEWFIPQSIHTDAYSKLKLKDKAALKGVHLDKGTPVVTVCAGGKTSMIAAEFLKKDGYEAYSLIDGMKGWSLAWNKAVLSFENYQIVQLRRTGKGCLSYIIVSGKNAIIIDASLPVEVYENILKQNSWQLKAVMETHIHADHLSRSKQLVDQLGVSLLLPIPNKVSFPYEKLEDGQIIHLDSILIKVIATPGHTLESVCFLVNDQILLSGDTIFTNAVGRPDLKANEEESKKRAGLLYDSLRKLMQLADETIVLPAHTNSPVDFDEKTVKATLAEIKKNVAILQLSKTDFVSTILDRLPPTPPNHLAIVERNLSGNISDVNPIDLEAGANRCAVS